MRISDWSSDVCSSDLHRGFRLMEPLHVLGFAGVAALLVMSPGPNGVLIAKTVPTSGRAAGFANVAGFVAGVGERIGLGLEARAVAEIGRASCRERVCQYV